MAGRARRATIKDIAVQVGVSPMTVSAVLNATAATNVRVSDATRELVIAAARQMQYRPNQAARSLRGRGTNIIGVYTSGGYLAPDLGFTAQILGGLHRGCEQYCKDLLLHSNYRERAVEEVFAELVDGHLDGLALYVSGDDPLVRLLAESGLPVVALVDAIPGLPSVVADNAGAGRIVASYLAARGHTRVFYGGSTRPLTSAVRQAQAFREAAQAHSMEVTVGAAGAGDDQWSEAALAWLDLPHSQRPTAAVCWNDRAAYHLLEHCERRGLRPPDDLAVVGFDAILPPDPTSWRLTTVRAPWVEVAQTAVSLLVRRLAGESLPEETVLPVEFIPGETA